IEQIGIQVEFLTTLIFVVVGGLFGGIALAFALGARKIVGNLIASQYLLQTHSVGQIVKIGEIRGSIREITPTAVVVETPEGRVFIPASKFQEEASTLTSDEG
ncbi:MAG TPA: mechanosensitive ion channel domain-containing protein, partial [Nitrospiria bacterium]|nr:mechanosensitive ion channel domain-containing protein [Nitrospiria bacterium]